LSPSWKNDERQLLDARQRLYKLYMEPCRRWANGFSCLCFVIVGAPLAIRMKNTDLMTSFIMCFLPILLVYYPLLMFGTSQAKSGSFPSWGVWAGNILLVIIGWRLTRHVCRY
jgi:lipopolysaccharide export system permease protein